MPPKRFSRQWNAALASLNEAIEQATKAGSIRLPSIRHLAAQTGISAVTMWKVAAELCRTGVLQSIPRGGLLVAGRTHGDAAVAAPPPAETPQPAALPRWRQVAAALRADVEALRYTPRSPLPTQKQLTALYQTSAGSMHRALAALVEEGLIVRAVRGHAVREDTRASKTAEVVVIAVTGSREDAHHTTPRATELWRHIDQECSHRNLRLRLCGFADVLPAIARHRGRLYERLCSDTSVMGITVLTLGLHADEALTLCGALGQTGKPLALIDELGQPFVAEAARQSGGRLFLMGGGPQSGRLIGEHLARMGHRHVAWIAPAWGDEDFWVLDRLSGLRAGLGAGGRPCSVLPLRLERFDGMGALDRSMEADPVVRELIERIRSIPDVIPPACPAPDYTFVRRKAQQYLWFRYVRREMEPLFGRALSDARPSAWVACNDEIAVMALDFLERHRVPVPGRIAVAGFDDGELAQTRDLTSYNFNLPAVIHAVFDFLIEPRSQRQKQRVLDMPGYVTVRASTSRHIHR